MYSVSSCILSNIREILDQSKAQILVYWYISCIETIRKCIQFLQILKVILCRNRNTLDYVHSSFKYLSLVTSSNSPLTTFVPPPPPKILIFRHINAGTLTKGVGLLKLLRVSGLISCI